MSAIPESFAFPVLIGDIGGTNARFAIIDDVGSAMDSIPRLGTADFPTFEAAVEEALARHGGAAPRTAILALAGPITGDRVPLTNSDWVIDPRALMDRFAMREVVLLNDFEAQSLALPGLTPDDLDPIGSGTATPTGTRVVVGPGTGLGAGALIHTRDMWVPIPSEGGHINFGPMSQRDFAVWPHIDVSFDRMSAETLISGPGLLRLYKAVCAASALPAPLDDAADVTAAGLAGDDPAAAETLQLFATYLGRFAGDLALIFAAYGGVYLAGGIPAKIAPALKSGAFREGFIHKAPHRAFADSMATAIIIKEHAALGGVADYARNPRGFGVELARRHWRA